MIQRTLRPPIRFARVTCLLLALIAVAVVAPAAAFTDFQYASLVLGQANFMSSAEDTTANGMLNPVGVAVDPTTGKLFVADNGNNRVLRFASAAALRNGVAAEGVLGQPDFTTSTADTTQTAMDSPFAVAVDSAGRLWVADNNNSRVLRFDAAAGKPNGAAANAVLGQPDFLTNTPGTTESVLDGPVGVAVDSAGRLWVADSNNNRVLRFDAAATLADGAAAAGVLGQVDFISNTAATTGIGMDTPFGVAVDGTGRLWVAEIGNSRVLRFDAAAALADGAAATGVLGQVDFTSNTGETTQTGMSNPYGVTVDGTGRLWVADYVNSRVLRFENAAAKANGAPADGVLGQPSFESADPDISQRRLNSPSAVAVDGTGRLWVADSGNNRVLRFDPPQPQPVPKLENAKQFLPFVSR